MPAIATEENLSTGDCGRTPTLPIGPYIVTATFGGKRIQIRGETVYNDHVGLPTHSGLRTVKSSQPTAGTMFFEHKPVAFVGDLLDDNDKNSDVQHTSYGV